MKRPKLAGVFLFVGCLLAYLMFVKRHYGAAKPEAYRLPPHHQQRPGLDRPVSFQYGIMFDAGSTGTRIHVFKFHTDNREAPKLAHETFRAIKPGLSAYADDPEKCTAGIVELLEVAKASVPPSVWSITPVVLKATAGLRLLPGEKADHLLDRVRALFMESPFLSRDDSVSIMDGTDEDYRHSCPHRFISVICEAAQMDERRVDPVPHRSLRGPTLISPLRTHNMED
eukprot:superscaffoldBa00009599_g24191